MRLACRLRSAAIATSKPDGIAAMRPNLRFHYLLLALVALSPLACAPPPPADSDGRGELHLASRVVDPYTAPACSADALASPAGQCDGPWKYSWKWMCA